MSKIKLLVIVLKTASALLTAFIIISSFSSCQKEITGSLLDSLPPQDSIPQSVSAKVKTYTEEVTSSAGNYSETFTLSYDAMDRVVSMIAASDPGSKFIYQYNNNNSYTMDIYVQNVVTLHVLFFINSLSLVDSTIQYNDTQDTSTEKYIYNAAKQLVVKHDYDYSAAAGSVLSNTTNYEYDSFGNPTKESDSHEVTAYDYTNFPNTLNVGLIYFPRYPNLPKTTSITSGGDTQTVDHTYTFDNYNRMITEKEVTNNGDIILKSYTY